MNNIKKMIFDYINQNDITEENLIKLFFTIAKESAKTKQINPLTQLFYRHTKDFEDILEDILQECYLEYMQDSERAYKNTMKYIYNTYFKAETNQNKTCDLQELEKTEHITTIYYENKANIQAYFNLQTDLQRSYIDSLLKRTSENLYKERKVFTSGRQKAQTINKLHKLDII